MQRIAAHVGTKGKFLGRVDVFPFRTELKSYDSLHDAPRLGVFSSVPNMAAPPPNLTSAFDPLTLADVLTAKATVANTGGKLDGGGPRSVVAVWETSTLREALDELAISGIKSVPVRVKLTGEILGFFDASVAVRVALDAVERGEGQTEAVALGKNVIDVIHPSLVSGTRGDGGSIPFACAALPLRELISDLGYLLFEQHCDNLYVNTEVRRVCVVETNQPSTDSLPKPLTPPDASSSYDATKAHGASQVAPTEKPKWEEIVDVVSQMDIVRCLLLAVNATVILDSERDSDSQYATQSRNLRRALRESVGTHASPPFCTFQDAPVAGVFREMIAKGIGAACVVRLGKWTLDGAGDASAWRAIDTLSFSDFTSPSFAEDSEDVLKETVGSFLSRGRDGAGIVKLMDTLGEDATMADAAQVMVKQQIHRCWIVDANGSPVGVVTCTDVLRCVATAIGRFEVEDRMQRAVNQAFDGLISEVTPAV